MCVAGQAWFRPSRRTSACIQMGHRGFMGLWGQQCHGNGLSSCGGCEDLLSVRSAILVTLVCHAGSRSARHMHTPSRTFGRVHAHAWTHGLADGLRHVKTTTFKSGPMCLELCRGTCEQPPPLNICSLLIYCFPLWKANMITIDCHVCRYNPPPSHMLRYTQYICLLSQFIGSKGLAAKEARLQSWVASLQLPRGITAEHTLIQIRLKINWKSAPAVEFELLVISLNRFDQDSIYESFPHIKKMALMIHTL